MNSPRLGLRVASVLAGLGGLAHLLRLVMGVELRIGACDVALWPSVAAVIVAGLLSAWFWRLASSVPGQTSSVHHETQKR